MIAIAVKKLDGEIKFNPGPKYVLPESDALIVMDHEEQVEKLGILAAARPGL